MNPEDKAKVQQALEAFDNLLYWDNGKPEYDEAREALTALRQLLEQEQACPHGADSACKECHEAEQPEQADLNLNCKSVQDRLATQWGYMRPSTWVGLTAKDLAEIPPSAYEGAIWADAKLKEKNT